MDIVFTELKLWRFIQTNREAAPINSVINTTVREV